MKLPLPAIRRASKLSPSQVGFRRLAATRAAPGAGGVLRGARAIGKGSRAKEPRAIEHRHALAIQGVWDVARGIVAYALLPLVRGWVSPERIDERDDRDLAEWLEELADEEGASALVGRVASSARPDPSIIDRIAITRQFEWLNITLGEWLITQPAKAALSVTSSALTTHTAEALSTLVGVNVRRAVPGLDELISGWVRENVALIDGGIRGPQGTTLRGSLLSEMEATLLDAHEKGLRVERLSKLVGERFDVSRSRAELIARDQTLKLNARITQHRQEQAGITSYRWSTSKDERVRPAHRKLDGTVHEWSKPPSEGHPGEAVRCRCQAIPIMPDWLD